MSEPSDHVIGGPVDPTTSPAPIEERSGHFTLMAPGWMPPQSEVSQCLGMCFTRERKVLLIAQADDYWSLPGGTPEAGETLLETLVREVKEEACAQVVDAEYLAAQHVYDPQNPEGVTSCFQTRWWAKVELEEWNPHYETTARQLVNPAEVTEVISWKNTEILARLMRLAVNIDRRRDS